MQCYRKAIRLSADCSRAHINLAPILMHAGQLEEAETLARRAMELDELIQGISKGAVARGIIILLLLIAVPVLIVLAVAT